MEYQDAVVSKGVWLDKMRTKLGPGESIMVRDSVFVGFLLCEKQWATHL